MGDWGSIIPEDVREVYVKAGFGKTANWSGNPALVIIDALWSFIGHERVDVLEAIKEYPTACGNYGWDGLDKIAQVLRFFRDMDLPVIYVCADGRMRNLFGATTRTKSPVSPEDKEAFAIPEIITPLAGEPVVYKTKASGFFRTPLDVLLRKSGVDTVLLAGSTTSGCIRASCVDAYSLGFETILLEDAIWDRSFFSHSVSLFELSMKYASVVDVDTACTRLSEASKKRGSVVI